MSLLAKPFDFLVKKLLLGKWIYEYYGCSSKTVRARSVYTGTLFNIICLGIIGLYFGFPYSSVKGSDLLPLREASSQIGLEGLSVTIFGLLGVYWAFFTTFRSEFADKYKRLASLIDNSPTQPDDVSVFSKYFDTFYTNFAEDCIHYHMEQEDAFKYLFNNTIGVLFIVKDVSELDFHRAMQPWEFIPKFMEEALVNKRKPDRHFYVDHIERTEKCRATRDQIREYLKENYPKRSADEIIKTAYAKPLGSPKRKTSTGKKSRASNVKKSTKEKKDDLAKSDKPKAS